MFGVDEDLQLFGETCLNLKRDLLIALQKRDRDVVFWLHPRHSRTNLAYAQLWRSRRPNDCRIDCKAAKHSDGDRGTPLADLERRTAGGVPPFERGLL